MPIYEYSCRGCEITFEFLASVGEANKKRPCPDCGRSCSRVISAFAIGAAGAGGDDGSNPGVRPHTHSLRAGRPIVPSFARPCWMDDRSAERFAAYKAGNGAEYDDRVAAREELRKRRGEPTPASPEHADSPVARMLARKKAREAAKVKAKTTKAAQGSHTHE